jgi:hypothetical protein
VSSFRGRSALLVAAVGLVVALGCVGRAAATGHRVLTVYSVATGLQYINSADDSVRGKVNNPLNSTQNRLAPKNSKTANGPSAGDIALYSLQLYSDGTLKRPAGTAVYTCYFNYNLRALCQAYYKLKHGATLVASGPVDFNKSGFTIVVTGGTTTYLGVRGEAKVVAAPRNAQRIDFEMIG